MPDPALAALTNWGAVPLSRAANRVHIVKAAEWGHSMGTDYWFQPNPGFDTAGGATTATGDELAENGWTATSLVNTAGSGADFASSADKGTPNHFLTNASADLLKSPAIFGDYVHWYFASQILGYEATKLVADFFGIMTVHTADEPRSGWGFVEDGGSPATEADQLAWISSDGTNFQIAGNAATPINGAADDANPHRFTITLNRLTGLVTWEIDGASQAMSSSLAVTADEFPVCFGFHALTTNRPALAAAHIYYI